MSVFDLKVCALICFSLYNQASFKTWYVILLLLCIKVWKGETEIRCKESNSERRIGSDETVLPWGRLHSVIPDSVTPTLWQVFFLRGHCWLLWQLGDHGGTGSKDWWTPVSCRLPPAFLDRVKWSQECVILPQREGLQGNWDLKSTVLPSNAPSI